MLGLYLHAKHALSRCNSKEKWGEYAGNGGGSHIVYIGQTHMQRWKGTNSQFSKNPPIMSTCLLMVTCLRAPMQMVNKNLYVLLYAPLRFWAFHSPTAVTHPGMLLNGVGTPSLTTMISHWKQVPTVTSWLFTVRVDSPAPPWGMKGPVVLVGAIVILVIVASPVTSQFGRKAVLLNWHVTVNMVGTGWFSQNDTLCELLLYPTRRKQAHTDFQ